MLVLCKCVFIITATIQNNEKHKKHKNKYFDQALCVSIRLVCCVIVMSINSSPFSLISMSDHTIIVPHYNTDSNMVSVNWVTEIFKWGTLC